AAVACAGIHTVRNVAVAMSPAASVYGPRCTRRRNASARRLLRPEWMMPAARMKTPRMKKTDELPNAAYASAGCMPPETASSAIVQHGVAHEVNTANVHLPWDASPAERGAF